MTQEFSMTIGGKSVRGETTFGVVNPSNGSVFAQAPECSREKLDIAFEAALAAQVEWAKDEKSRSTLLREAADALLAVMDSLGEIVTLEQGKPLAEGKSEVAYSAAFLNYFAGLDLPAVVVKDDAEAYAEVARRPIGVVSIITPWNFPLAMPVQKLAPALRAGNTVVLKPSPFTPLSALAMGEILQQILPPGVLNIVSGGDALGAWMCEHPTPRKVTFTGSTPTGKSVAVSSAEDLKRVTLELGGNDPAIVLDDAVPSEIADRIFWGAFANNGQICLAIKRLYVPRAMQDTIVGELADRARSVHVGDGMLEDSQLGPIQNKPQFDRVSELTAEAIDKGAKVACGGGPIEGDGYFFKPTILFDLPKGTRIVNEEQFGPVLPVIAYDTVEEALQAANDTKYGLGGSVWGSDTERASEVARRIESGTTWVNTHIALPLEQPFGGLKWSGIGVENGDWGLHEFTDIQVLHRSKI